MAKRGFCFKPKPKGTLDAESRPELAPEEREARREAGRSQGKARRGRKDKKRLSARERRLDAEKQAVLRESLEERKARIKKNYKPRGEIIAADDRAALIRVAQKAEGKERYNRRCRLWRERDRRETCRRQGSPPGSRNG